MTPLRLFFDTLTAARFGVHLRCQPLPLFVRLLSDQDTLESIIVVQSFSYHLPLFSTLLYAIRIYLFIFLFIYFPHSCKRHFLIVHTRRCLVFSVADSLKIPTVDKRTIRHWTTFCYKIATAYNMQRCSIVKLSSRTIFNNVPNENYVSR